MVFGFGDGRMCDVQAKKKFGNAFYYLYDGQQPVCEFNAAGGLTAVNTFGANGLVSRHAGGGSVFYTFDTRGDATGYLSGSGRGCQQYAAFGQFLDDFQYPFLFGAQWGAYTDAATGLTLLTHRFYDPSTGRFLTRDPAGYAGGVNLYAYVGNNPVNFADPMGFLGFSTGVGVVVGGIFGGIVTITAIGIIGATAPISIPVGIGIAIGAGAFGGALGGATAAAIDGNDPCQGAIDGAEKGGLGGILSGITGGLGKLLPPVPVKPL